jgi:hypothetical protein
MNVRLWVGMSAACCALAAACDGSNVFGTGLGTNHGTSSGTATVQGSVLAGGSGLGAVPVILVGQDSTNTDANGVFVFDSLAAATYTLAVRIPLGYTLAAGQTATRPVTVGAGGTSGVTIILQRTTTVP